MSFPAVYDPCSSLYSQFNKEIRGKYSEMRKALPWFNPQKHYLVTIEDEDGNTVDLVGAASTISSRRPVLREAYRRADRLGNWVQVNVMQNGRSISFLL